MSSKQKGKNQNENVPPEAAVKPKADSTSRPASSPTQDNEPDELILEVGTSPQSAYVSGVFARLNQALTRGRPGKPMGVEAQSAKPSSTQLQPPVPPSAKLQAPPPSAPPMEPSATPVPEPVQPPVPPSAKLQAPPPPAPYLQPYQPTGVEVIQSIPTFPVQAPDTVPPPSKIRMRQKPPSVEQVGSDTAAEAFLDLSTIFEGDAKQEQFTGPSAVIETEPPVAAVQNPVEPPPILDLGAAVVTPPETPVIIPSEMVVVTPPEPAVAALSPSTAVTPPEPVALPTTAKADAEMAPANRATMLPLIDRLEQQVNKATSKLMAQVEHVLNEMESQTNLLAQQALTEEHRSEDACATVASDISEHLDTAAEDVRSKILDLSAEGQRSIQSVLESGNATINDKWANLRAVLADHTAQLKGELEQVTKTAQEEFKSLVEQRAGDVEAIMQSASTDWETRSSTELQNIDHRCTKASKIIHTEEESVAAAIEQYCQSFGRDIDEIRDQATEQIELTLDQYSSSSTSSLQEWQQHLTASVKAAINAEIRPYLKNYREKWDNKVAELKNEFKLHCEMENSNHLAELETQMDKLKHKFRSLASGSLATVGESAEQQKLQLVQLFEECRGQIAARLRDTENQFETAEAKIKASDTAIWKLLMSSGSNLGSSLAVERDQLISSLQEIKRSSIKDLEDVLQQDTAHLEELGDHEQKSLVHARQEGVRIVKDECQAAIIDMQAEVRKSFQEIQKAREKFLQ